MKNELNGKRPALRLFALKTCRVCSHGCFFKYLYLFFVGLSLMDKNLQSPCTAFVAYY